MENNNFDSEKKLIKMRFFTIKIQSNFFPRMTQMLSMPKIMIWVCDTSTVRLVIRPDGVIGWFLLYTKNALSSLCTNLHKHEQKDRRKTFTGFTDHILTGLNHG